MKEIPSIAEERTFRSIGVPVLFLLFLFLLNMFGCVAGKSVVPPVTVESPKAKQEVAEPRLEEADYECSYFYFLWGRYAELSARYEEALEAYEKALICDPAADYISRKIPVLLLRLDRDQEAGEYLQKYLRRHPRDIGIRFLLAKIYIRREEYQKAIDQYRELHQQNPMEVQALLLMSELYLARREYDAARATLQEILSLKEDSYPAHILLARSYGRDKQVEAAEKEYRRALELNWSSDLQLELGDMFLQNGEYDKAEKEFRDILARDSDHEIASVALIHVLLLQKKEDAALKELNHLKTITDRPEHAELTIARIYGRRKEFGKALRILDELLADREIPQARYLAAIIYFQQKKYEKALEQLQRIPPDDENWEDALFLQVRLLRLLNRTDDAVALLKENLDKTPPVNTDLYVLLASLYVVQGEKEKGRAVMLKGIKANPEDDGLLYEYGLFLEDAGEHEQAMNVMQKVLALNPNHSAALNYVGYTWADSGERLQQALEYIQRAVKLDPENGYIQDSLGWVHYRLGHLDEAARNLEKALKLSPNDPGIMEHLADVYVKTGRKTQALELYRKAGQLFSLESEKKRIQGKIQAIEQGAN